MDEIISEFLIESYEGLDQLDQNLLVLEESPDDTGVLKEVFRTLHTIKGTCGFLAFTYLERLAHAGENLLSLLRDGKLAMTPEIADALLATVDKIRDILGTIEQTEAEGEPEIEELVAVLAALAEGKPSQAAAPAGEAGDSAAEAAAEGETPADGAAPAEADGAAEVAEAAATDGAAPAEGEAAPTEGVETPPTERIGDMLVDAGAAERTDVEIAAAEQALGDDRKLGKILVDDGRAKEAEVENAAQTQKSGSRSSADSTIRVDVALLDRLMNLVGELVLSRNQIVQLVNDKDDNEYTASAQRLNLITSELQEGVMKTRMQPINNVWNKLPRVVRDLSNQLGKKVRIEMVGKETELDRTIIEAIKDPLTHIVRNTVDHGIEMPDDRVAAGKDPEGVLMLRASHEGGQVNIEITDDGKGIPAGPILAKAVDKGFLDADAASRLTEKEAVQLIFKPGFSTAAKVSNVSGRGVGMDVVKTSIERIGGTVDLQTEQGKGTTLNIKIPLTLAIIPALTVTCDGARYAIPQVNLLELVRLDGQGSSGRIEELHGAPVYRLRGNLLPVVDLREELFVGPSDDEVTNVVVLNADGHHFGLIVDTIEDTEEIVVKPLGRQIKDLKLFSGATIMGDGRIALILDVMGLADGANLLSGSGEQEIDDVVTTSTSLVDERTLLLLGLGEQQQVAIPLASVERLEEFPVEMVERSEGRLVVQYRQKIMPLVDLGATIGMGYGVFDDATHVSVIVCSFGGHTVGLAVREVLDIVSNAEVLETISEDSESVVVHGLITDVIDAAAVVSSVLPIAYSQSDEYGDQDAYSESPIGV